MEPRTTRDCSTVSSSCAPATLSGDDAKAGWTGNTAALAAGGGGNTGIPPDASAATRAARTCARWRVARSVNGNSEHRTLVRITRWPTNRETRPEPPASGPKGESQ